jgi:glycosyltransferase involved in cell wall biosynthesis
MENRTSPLISVNIPIFNGEKTIARAVQSILDQDFKDFELIVINDCSKDSTPQILNEFTDPRMKVIHHEQNQGISRTRNHLLKSSVGRYIAVLDGDDFALPHRLQTQVEVMEKEFFLAGVFSSVLTYKGQDPYDTLPGFCSDKSPSQMRETILFESVFPHSTAFLKKEAFGSGYREDLQCAEDYAKWLELVFGKQLLRTLAQPVSHTWFHAPAHYTREKMRINVMSLQSHYFLRLLGRELTETELASQWSLYEPLEWNPTTKKEAFQHLEEVRDWMITLYQSHLSEPTMDSGLFHREAERRLYQLLSRAVHRYGLSALKFTRGLAIDQRLKLLAKSFMSKVNS